MITSEADILKCERLLAVDPPAELSDYLRHRYPQCKVCTANSILEAIDDLTRHPVRAVIAYVDASHPQLSDAVAGLRDAAGERAKILLCCHADAEPSVRRLMQSGADDYVILPVDGDELDAALGYALPADAAPIEALSPSLDELERLSDLLAHLDQDRFTVVCKIADVIRAAMGGPPTTIVVEGSGASSGGTVADPVLVEPICRDGQTVGQISVAARQRPFGPEDTAKLRHYADLTAHLLAAANRQRKWRMQAMTDEVSGLYNRRYVKCFLDDLLIRARRERFRVTVLLFDIDDFKAYNDRYGHAAGDDIIRCVGRLFKDHCREHDVVTRYGGDEFCVVFWDADRPRVAGSDHPSDALSLLARFQEALKSYRCESLGDEAKGCLTISGGLASFPWDATTTEELIEKADQALMQAKLAGKNRVFVFGDRTDCDNT